MSYARRLPLRPVVQRAADDVALLILKEDGTSETQYYRPGTAAYLMGRYAARVDESGLRWQVTRAEETMTKINETELASVRLALAAAVAEKGGDYVYEKPMMLFHNGITDEWYKEEADSCLYLAPVFDDDDTITDYVPSCIWGHALLTLGVDKDALLEHNRDESIGSVTMPVPWRDPVITMAAAEAQITQDRGEPWSAAVAAFERAIAEAAGA